MKKETLRRANEIECAIEDIRFAMETTRESRHFAMMEHYGLDAVPRNLPKSLTPKIMRLLSEERERLEQELERLHDDNLDNHEEFVPTDKYNEEEQPNKEEQPTTQEEKHGMIWKLFWSFVLAIILIGTSSLCVAFTCYAIGDSFGIQTLACGVLFGTVWLASYILIDKNE